VRILSVVTVVAVAAMAMAQQPNQQRPPQPDETFTSAADVEAMIAKATSERKADQALFLQPLVRLAPYAVNLEYRVEEIDTPAAVHEKEGELIFVVDGAGTLTTGGKLVGRNGRTRLICRGPRSRAALRSAARKAIIFSSLKIRPIPSLRRKEGSSS
jgi:hypothetical protein